jgi:uncharacterized protein with HEPN domain
VSYKDWRVRIDDMLEAIERSQSYLQGMDRPTFEADQRTQDAVARNLEIIGEAASKMPADVRQRHPLVPWGTLAEMRHILIHEYHSVDPAILYGTVCDELPPLVVLLKATLDDPLAPATWSTDPPDRTT